MAAAARHTSANGAGVSAGPLTRYSVRPVLTKRTHSSQSDQSEVDRMTPRRAITPPTGGGRVAE